MTTGISRGPMPQTFAKHTPRKGQVALALLAVVALILTLVLSFFVRDYVRVLAVAQQDQNSWRSAQIEVEYLKLSAAIDRARETGGADLDALRERFDIFYSRLPLIQPDTLDPDARQRLAEMKAMLDRLIPLVDGTDAQLLAGLDRFESELLAQSDSPRIIALGSISGVVEAKAHERQRIAWLLEGMLGLIVATTLILILSIIFLIRRTNSLQSASVLADERHRQLMAVLNGSLDAIVVTDSSQTVIDFNGSAEKIFGYASQDVVGRNGIDLFTPKGSRAALRRDLKSYLSTGQTNLLDRGSHEMNMLRADGTEFPAQFTSSTAQTRGGPIFISYIRDMTPEKRHEAEILRARDAALQAFRERSRFFAMMSHEMRTPLNGVLSSLYLLEESPLLDEQREHLNTALFSGDILMSHINDVLAIERSESEEEFTAEPCDIAALTTSMVGMMESLARSFEVTLDLQQKGIADQRFMTAPRAVQQILINLLSNAIKFSPQGAVSLFARYIATSESGDHGTLRFEVSDTGIGIAPEDQARIFEDFVSLDSRYERRTGGTGLGLGIVRRLCERLDGSIRCESSPGEGTSFVVDLPVALAACAPQDTAEPGSRAIEGAVPKRILVVDDNSVNRDLLNKMLELAGHRVTMADGGQAAIDQAGAQPFDLILMDISMPGVSGTQATRIIRGQPGPNRSTPIVAFTAHALPHEQEAFREAGMSGFLLKPVHRKALHACVQKDYDAPGQGDGADDAPLDDTGVLDADQVSDLLDIFGKDQMRERLDAFCAESRGQLDALETACAAEDHAALQAASHSLAGICGMMGAAALHVLLQDIERASKSGRHGDVRALVGRIPGTYADSCAAWAKIMA